MKVGGDSFFDVAIKAVRNGKRLDGIHIKFYRDDKNIRKRESSRISETMRVAIRHHSRVCGSRL